MRRVANIRCLGALAALAVVCPATSASAQDEEIESGAEAATVAAPAHAFELTLDAGLLQAAGVSERPDAGAGRGYSGGVTLGWRASPWLSFDLSGKLQRFEPDVGPRDDEVRSAVTSVGFGFHLAPERRFDPVVNVGMGYRVMWRRDRAGAEVFLHGIQIAKAELALDVRLGESVAIGPVMGADLDTFLWIDSDRAPGRQITRPGVDAFFYAGVAGRFDLGGYRVGRVSRPTLARR